MTMICTMLDSPESPARVESKGASGAGASSLFDNIEVLHIAKSTTRFDPRFPADRWWGLRDSSRHEGCSAVATARSPLID